MALNVKEVLDILTKLEIKQKYEILPIEESINRICAENIISTIALPKFNNSAMDGYALKYEDINSELSICETIFAGDNKNINLKDKECTKIMTGAKVPENATLIVPKEECIIKDEKVIINNKNLKKYSHIRFIGEDVDFNQILIEEGTLLNSSHITLLSSQGISHIKLYKKPKITVFASGEELKLHYEKIEDYQIYNSNTPTLIAKCRELHCEVNFIGQAKDSVKSLQDLINNSLDSDLIITSGGVSVGDADFTNEAFKGLGFKEIFKGIEIKPGKPTIFGKIEKTFILNLPGNPLASSLIFELFGKTLIQKLLGEKSIYQNYINAKIGTDLKIKKGRITIIPGLFDGEYFYPEEKRLPGMVSTLSKCNAMIVVDKDLSKLEKNSKIKILPLNWKFFSKEYKDFITYE